jgi:hypothetical protein
VRRAGIRTRSFILVGLLLSVDSCASVGERHYRSGVDAYARGDAKRAIFELSSFVGEDCYFEAPPPARGDVRCHVAELDLARAYRQSGHPAWALLGYDKMQVWQTSAEVIALKPETDEAKAALQTALSGSTVPVEIRFRHDAASSFRIFYALLFLDGKKVFDSREHATPVDMAAGWVPLFSGSLPDGEHAVGFKVAYISRPAVATPGPYVLTRNRVVGGQGKPILLDAISLFKPGTVTSYGSMAIAMGLRPLVNPTPDSAESLEDPVVLPQN